MATEQDHASKLAFFFFAATLLLWLFSLCFHLTFNGRSELLPVLLACLFFQTANGLIRHFASPDSLFVNTAVSLLHSAIVSSSVGFILVKQWLENGWSQMLEHSQLVNGTWPRAYAVLGVSCGYFAYDQYDMLRYRLYSGWIPAILVHHLIILVCFTLALYRNVTINYLILSLVCEVHSIFLHVRKVRRMAGYRDTKGVAVSIEWGLNWLTFFVARLASAILITVKLINDAHKFEKGVELPLALLGMAGLNLLNVFLGIDLFNAFRREKSRTNHRNE